MPSTIVEVCPQLSAYLPPTPGQTTHLPDTLETCPPLTWQQRTVGTGIKRCSNFHYKECSKKEMSPHTHSVTCDSRFHKHFITSNVPGCVLSDDTQRQEQTLLMVMLNLPMSFRIDRWKEKLEVMALGAQRKKIMKDYKRAQ